MFNNFSFKVLIISFLALLIVAGAFYFSGKESRTIINENTKLEDEGKENKNISEENEEEGKEETVNEEEEPLKENENPETTNEITEEKEEKNQESESNKSSSYQVIDNLVNWGFQSSSDRKVDTVIVHSSYDALGEDPYNLEGIIQIYKDYGVAAHYIIDRDGRIYRLVEEDNVAYHAGLSSVPDGRENVNDFSIGIELVNTKEDEYTKEQYENLNGLISEIKNRHEIEYILGHDQIAPGRKTDPWNFDWDKLKY